MVPSLKRYVLQTYLGHLSEKNCNSVKGSLLYREFTTINAIEGCDMGQGWIGAVTTQTFRELKNPIWT